MQDACRKCRSISIENSPSAFVVYKTIKCKTANIYNFVASNFFAEFSELPLFIVALFFSAGS